MIEDRLKINPKYEIYLSVNAQLDYIIDILNNESSDKQGLNDIVLGYYAVREFEDSDKELAKILLTISFLARKILYDSLSPVERYQIELKHRFFIKNTTITI